MKARLFPAGTDLVVANDANFNVGGVAIVKGDGEIAATVASTTAIAAVAGRTSRVARIPGEMLRLSDRLCWAKIAIVDGGYFRSSPHPSSSQLASQGGDDGFFAIVC